MAYLITYSQTEDGRELSANCATGMRPAIWLLDMNKRYPDCINKLLFAIEITEEEYDMVSGEI